MLCYHVENVAKLKCSKFIANFSYLGSVLRIPNVNSPVRWSGNNKLRIRGEGCLERDVLWVDVPSEGLVGWKINTHILQAVKITVQLEIEKKPFKSIFNSGSQRWKQGGPPKININILVANHTPLKNFSFFRTFN